MMKSLFILLLLPLLLLLHSSFFLLPHNPQAPSLPHHPWAVSQNPINFVYFSFAPLYHPRPAQPHPIPCHAMPCPPKKKRNRSPSGTVLYCRQSDIPSPLTWNPLQNTGRKKKNRSHPSRWCIWWAAGGVGIFDGTFFYFFMIDRTGGGYYYLVYIQYTY